MRAQSSVIKEEQDEYGVLNKFMEIFNRNFLLLSTTLVLQFNSISCLLWSLFNDAEIQPRIRLDQEENAMNIICREMDSRTESQLTPLNKFCLTCLTYKYEHLEHCDSTNKCIKNFHLHSTLLNRSFSNRNIRGYIVH